MMSIPVFRTKNHEKIFLGFSHIQTFLVGTIILTIYSSQLISPNIKLATDQEMKEAKGYLPMPNTNFGLGEPCLYELKQGMYLY